MGQGAPQPLILSVTRVRLQAHAIQALGPTQRTMTALSHLATEAKRRSLVRQLLIRYATLISLYARARGPHVPPNWKDLAGAVSAAERATRLEAHRIRLPFCAL